MVNFSKKYLDEHIKNEGWRDFAESLTFLGPPRDIKKFLDNYLSASERIVFEKRILILFLLKQKWSYRRIAETLDVSRSSISFIKNGFVRKSLSRKNRRTGNSAVEKKNKMAIPTITGKGRWRFLNNR